MVALPFITYNTVTSQYTVNEEAVAFLSSLNKALAVVSMVGRSRSGKSFALNNIILNKRSFEVGNTVNACTRGIYIHNELEVWETESGEQINVVVLDSEGLASTDNAANDPQIFTFLLLLSSMVIYNVSGAIDATALQNLNLVTNLSKSVRIQCDRDATSQELADILPTFVFLVRDFTLQLTDTHGKDLDANGYLEAAIAPNGSADDSIKSVIRESFPDRMCFTLVRPCQEEEDLKRLDELPDRKLRPIFLIQREEFRALLRARTKNKSYFGNPVSGNMLVAMAQNFVKGVNSGAIPAIKDSWQTMMELRASETLDMCVDLFDQTIHSYENSHEIKSFESLQAWLLSEKKKAVAYLKQHLEKSLIAASVQKLDKKLSPKIEALLNQNTFNLKRLLTDFIAELANECANMFELDNLQKLWLAKTEEVFCKVQKSESVEAIWSSLSLGFLWKQMQQIHSENLKHVKTLEDQSAETVGHLNELQKQLSVVNDALKSCTSESLDFKTLLEATRAELRTAIESCESKTQDQLQMQEIYEACNSELIRQVGKLQSECADLHTANESQSAQIGANTTMRFELAEAVSKLARLAEQNAQLKSSLQANEQKFAKFMEQTKQETLVNAKKIKDWQTKNAQESGKCEKALELAKSEHQSQLQELQTRLESAVRERDRISEVHKKLAAKCETESASLSRAQSISEEEKRAAVSEAKAITDKYMDFQTKSNTKTRELETKLACTGIELQNCKRRLSECEEDATSAKRLKFESQRLEASLEAQIQVVSYLEKDKLAKDRQVEELCSQISKLEERYTTCVRDRDMDLIRFQNQLNCIPDAD
jgi:hypothetical protein